MLSSSSPGSAATGPTLAVIEAVPRAEAQAGVPRRPRRELEPLELARRDRAVAAGARQ